MKRLQSFDSSLFIGKSYFNIDIAQLYLILQLLFYILKSLGDTEKDVSWKSKGSSAEKLTTIITTVNNLSPSIKWYQNFYFCLIFKKSCLKQKNATVIPPNKIIFFIKYELDTWSWDLNSNFTLKDCLFAGGRLAKNADQAKYIYTFYDIGFDSRDSIIAIAIISGIDMSSYVRIDNKKKYFNSQ